MTIITVRHPTGLFDEEQRATLATTLTDAVLEVECGTVTPVARWGFQVHFLPIDRDAIAIGGSLLSRADDDLDAMVVDIAVMDGSWSTDDRRQVITNIGEAFRAALGLEAVPSTWWVTFRSIDEGSWGAAGAVLSILDLLDPSLFTDVRSAQIRHALVDDGHA